MGVAVGMVVAVAVAGGGTVAVGGRVVVGLGAMVGIDRAVDVAGTGGVTVGVVVMEHDATKSMTMAIRASLRKEYS